MSKVLLDLCELVKKVDEAPLQLDANDPTEDLRRWEDRLDTLETSQTSADHDSS
jgi:hypothetical protein